ITVKNYREYYHDSLEYKDELISMFNLGQLDLAEKARGETLFFKICQKIYRFIRQTDNESEEFDYVRKLMSKRYIGNFSLFQSMPDFWAIGQLFPIVPIQKLNRQPECMGTILDMTCDSDGEIDRFTDVRDVKDMLELHSLDRHPYYVAVLLLGAYQDAIGDLHNLFGAVHEAHVVVKGEDEWVIKKIIKGDNVSSVLKMQNFSRTSLVESVELSIEKAVEDNELSPQYAKSILNNIKREINDYTYLDF
ncbi:MAG: biosynthetic arginine decarboxylase, partial [Methanosarcinales archaeon]|nr:biosynthetic arginine decarboxylase [Methanosarcinales archaeon]